MYSVRYGPMIACSNSVQWRETGRPITLSVFDYDQWETRTAPHANRAP